MIKCYSRYNKKINLDVYVVFLLIQALEYSQQGEKVPSCVLDATDQWGGLYLGGYRAVMNEKFLKTQKVSSIVNTAKGLEIFGPKYLVSQQVSVRLCGPFYYVVYQKGSCGQGQRGTQNKIS